VGSDGELEEEVDLERIVSDQDREQAAELKVKANKAFAGESGRGWRSLERGLGTLHSQSLLLQFSFLLARLISHTISLTISQGIQSIYRPIL
jgi:hypothetical protein